jgi:hypothetical protein
MENEQIQRSRLFRENFLPGAVARLRNQSSARVVGVRNNDLALDNVDKTQLIDNVKRFILDWDSSGGSVDTGLRDAIEKNTAIIQSPSEIYVSPYPLLLRCERCSVIDFYDSRSSDDRVNEAIKRRIKRTGKGRSHIACKSASCGGRMLQVPFVGVHRCGVMDPIHVPPAARRRTNIGFKDVGGSFFNNYFFDVDSHEKLGGALQDNCPACRVTHAGLNEITKRGTPVTSGDSFYSQIIQYIALSKKVGGLVSLLTAQVNATAGTLAGQTCDIAEGVACVLLDIVESTELEKQLSAILEVELPSEQVLTKHKADLVKSKAARAKYLASTIDDDDELMGEMLAAIDAKIANLESLLSTVSGRFKKVRDFIDNDETLIALVSERRSLEAAFLRHDVRRLTVLQSIRASSDPVVRATKESHLTSLKTRYGIADIAHIPDLLVVLSALGFTRERRAPSTDINVPPVSLNGFADSHDETLRGRPSLYAMSAKTEAVWIRLDAIRILRWCIDAAGWKNPGSEALANTQSAHAYLLQHCSALTMAPGQVRKHQLIEKTGESAPFHLLHTICHALLATSRRHTGYDDQSLMEYLLPMDLSFVIYVTSVQNFTAGGLLTLFQHYLLQWFDDASIYAFNCAFDPICSDNGGSCSGCVQRERACETFNHGLSRAYLHGGNIDRDYNYLIKKGFWDVEG